MQPFFTEFFFWFCTAIVFYTYLGYGLILYVLVHIKTIFYPAPVLNWEGDLPSITVLIAAYNEEKVVEEKMANCRALNYPQGKLQVVWITDGSNDHTNEKLARYPEVKVLYRPQRQGKTAALNRAVPLIDTPYIVFTDANTILNTEAILEIVQCFGSEKTGGVAGEKRISVKDKDNATAGGEGFYWKYESRLKAWDSQLYSTVGAAGELFAIRRELFEPMPPDTLLDDFILSMRIAEKGYKIAYCDRAYALEDSSADIKNEEKRKIRIAAGGLQSIGRLRHLLIPNPFHLGLLPFQYISHRVLRWSVTPVVLFLLIPLNLLLAFWPGFSTSYFILFLLQGLFYSMAFIGHIMQRKNIEIKGLFIPYYFVFMNLNVLKAFFYLKSHKGQGTWEKAERRIG